jgi:hypothetical protein
MNQTIVLFNALCFTFEEYDHAWEEPRAVGQSHPKGVASHIGFAKSDEIWMEAGKFDLTMPRQNF